MSIFRMNAGDAVTLRSLGREVQVEKSWFRDLKAISGKLR